MTVDHAARSQVHHVPVVGRPAADGEDRTTIVFDANGLKIGASPHVRIEQVTLENDEGVITTTLKITPLNGT